MKIASFLWLGTRGSYLAFAMGMFFFGLSASAVRHSIDQKQHHAELIHCADQWKQTLDIARSEHSKLEQCQRDAVADLKRTRCVMNVIAKAVDLDAAERIVARSMAVCSR